MLDRDMSKAFGCWQRSFQNRMNIWQHALRKMISSKIIPPKKQQQPKKTEHRNKSQHLRPPHSIRTFTFLFTISFLSRFTEAQTNRQDKTMNVANELLNGKLCSSAFAGAVAAVVTASGVENLHHHHRSFGIFVKQCVTPDVKNMLAVRFRACRDRPNVSHSSPTRDAYRAQRKNGSLWLILPRIRFFSTLFSCSPQTKGVRELPWAPHSLDGWPEDCHLVNWENLAPSWIRSLLATPAQAAVIFGPVLWVLARRDSLEKFFFLLEL